MRAVLVLATALAVTTAASAAGLERPVLRVTGTAPQVVYGAKFRANERVVVTVQAPKPTKIVVRTDRHGSFRLPLPWLGHADRCRAFIVSAVGPAGERAVAGMGTFGCSTPGVTIPGADS